MKYCSRCQVSVDNPVHHCPLCYSTLTQKDDSPEYMSYPNLLEKAKKYHLVYRIMLMLSLTAVVVTATINFLTYEHYPYFWSLIVLANIGYMWIAVTTAIRRRFRLGLKILTQVTSLAALCVAIDFYAGLLNWALNYVVPFLFISATLSITILIIVRRMDLHSFLLYFILTALLGFLPLLFLALKLVTVLWPSLVSVLYSGLSLISIFVFANNDTKLELKKRLHI